MAVLKQLLGVSGWPELESAINPSPEVVVACQDAVTALQSCLQAGTARLVGSAASGLHLPSCDADIVVLLPGFSLQGHAAAVANIAAAVQGRSGAAAGFQQVQQGEFSVQCRRKGLNIDILVGSTEPVEPLAFLDPNLTSKQRQALSASTAVRSTAFLQHQAPLYKTAVRMVKHWVKHMHKQDWSAEQRNRPKSYLLALLTLEAYQQHMAEAATAAGSSSSVGGSFSSHSSHDHDAVQGSIMMHFLRLVAGLNSSTLLLWGVHYSRPLVQGLLRSSLADVLRPEGCRGYSLVLDPANPTNNVAAALPDISRLVQLAAADLAAVEAGVVRQLEQQLQAAKLELQTGQAEMKQELAKSVAAQQQLTMAIVAHQCIVVSKTPCSWDFSIPVSAWLPSSKPGAMTKSAWWSTIGPGLCLQVSSLPFQAQGYGSPSDLLAFEIKLAADESGLMRDVADAGLPIPLAIDGSRSTVEWVDRSNYGGASKLPADILGNLSGSSGVQVLFGRDDGVLRHLSVVDYYYSRDDAAIVQGLERCKQHSIRFKLSLKFGI